MRLSIQKNLLIIPSFRRRNAKRELYEMVGHHYYKTKNSMLKFQLEFGLIYKTFTFARRLSKQEGNIVLVNVMVSNVGRRDGRQTIDLVKNLQKAVKPFLVSHAAS